MSITFTSEYQDYDPADAVRQVIGANAPGWSAALYFSRTLDVVATVVRVTVKTL
ncbi:MAG: hypothetical protein ACOYEP_11240 [Limnochordia bacterium]